MPDPGALRLPTGHETAHAHGLEYLPQDGETPYIVEEPETLTTASSRDQTSPAEVPSLDESKLSRHS